MKLQWRRRRTIAPGLTATVTPHGVTVSKRLGRVQVSSSGRVSVRLGGGFWVRLR